MSEDSIEFSLSNSEQRDSWLNSGHRTLDADTLPYSSLMYFQNIVFPPMSRLIADWSSYQGSPSH